MLTTIALTAIIHATPVLTLGAQVVAAEARGESFAERMRVACVIANRADDPTRWRGNAADPWRSVMLAPRQFAAPYPARPEDAAAFVLGAMLRPCGTATMFATPDAVGRLGLAERWGTVTYRGAHWYFDPG